MPAPPKTSDAEIVATARALVERLGHDGFSMNDVATAVGVRAPSLYNRFEDRAALLAAVDIEILRSFARALRRAPRSEEPVATLTAYAHAYRTFAKRNPRGYALVFGRSAARTEAATKARADGVAVLLPALAALVGEKGAFAAARVLVPFLHGFVSMELADEFRLGGGIDAAFDHGVATILAGLTPGPRR